MKVKDSLDDFAADKDPPLLTMLLEAIEDDAIFPRNQAHVVVKSSPHSRYYGDTRPATKEELLSFQTLCRDAMRDLYKCALYFWLGDKNPALVDFFRCSEVIEQYLSLLFLNCRYFDAAIIHVAERQDHLEEDAKLFLYFMLGVYRVSREDGF